MEAISLRDTIREITKDHLENHNGMIMGQCLSAIGWVNGTVPDTVGVVELPMTDIAGAGFAVGAAVAGRRPILVIRFQDFLLLNNSPIINFAAKRKGIWGKSVPVFVRALAIEGNGTGPTHSGKLHSIFMHFPGVRVWCPITPNEWRMCWKDYMEHDDPMLCFEHRLTFDRTEEICDVVHENADVTIFAISYARINALGAVKQLEQQGLKVNFINIYELKPFCATYKCLEALKYSKFGFIVDSGYEICSASRDLAYQLMIQSDRKVYTLGLADTPVGCSKETENATPTSDQISEAVAKIMRRWDNGF